MIENFKIPIMTRTPVIIHFEYIAKDVGGAE